PGLGRNHVVSTHSSTRLRQGVENPSPGKQTGGDGGREQGIGSERHSRGNTWGNIPRLGRCLSTAGGNCNAQPRCVNPLLRLPALTRNRAGCLVAHSKDQFLRLESSFDASYLTGASIPFPRSRLGSFAQQRSGFTPLVPAVLAPVAHRDR